MLFFTSYGQVDSSFLQIANQQTLPYSLEKQREGKEATISLSEADSLFFLEHLWNTELLEVNPYACSAFGEFNRDWITIFFEDSHQIDVRVQAVFTWRGGYLIDFSVRDMELYGETFHFLVSFNEQGEFVNWLCSGGSFGAGNPNGTVSREMTIEQDSTITIREYSGGRNNVRYSFDASLKVATDKNIDAVEGELVIKTASILFYDEED